MSSQQLHVRPVRLEDRAQLLEICRRRRYPQTVFQSAEEMRERALAAVESRLEELADSPQAIGLVVESKGEIRGYALAEKNALESITHEPQTVVAEQWGEDPEALAALFDRLADLGRESGDRYLVCYLFADQSEQVPLLERRGYRSELLRVAKPVGPDHNAPSHPNFRIRKANSTDMLFVMSLVAQHSPIYTPAHREGDKILLQQRFVGLYAEMDVNDPRKVPLILEEIRTKEQMGYIILEPRRVFETSGQLILYIYDIAVGESGAGQGLSRYLCGGGEALLARMGGGVFFGDISADNVLAVGAQRGLGFTLDSTRWGLRL